MSRCAGWMVGVLGCLWGASFGSAAEPPACPAGATLVGQSAYEEGGESQLYVSNSLFPDFDPANGGVKLLEHFKGAGGPIDGLGWWGVSAVIDDNGRLIGCPLEPGEFLIEFYAQDPDFERPDYALGPVASFTASEATGLVKTAAGPVYAGHFDTFELSYWEAPLLPYTAFEGWIAIQNVDICQFWWAGAAWWGDDAHVSWYEATGIKEDTFGDLSYCLTAEDAGPFTGACCHEGYGYCVDTYYASGCDGPRDVWHPDVTCGEIDCCPTVWACCMSGTCGMLDQASCESASGTTYWHYVCSTTDPRYDPSAFGGAGNQVNCPPGRPCPIACPSGAAFSRPLSGGYLYPSIDRPGEQLYAIDNYTGFAGPIVRVHWWGNTTVIWSGPDCEFAQPAPFVIRFYNSVGSPPTGPDWEHPICTYNLTAEWCDTGYIWSGPGELGSINGYEATLWPPCTPGTGLKWISIASATEDCDFIWDPGSDSVSGLGLWVMDNGVANPEPGRRHCSFCLYSDALTGACCNEITGVCQNSQTEAACVAAGGVFYLGKGCVQIPGGCHAHQGACCDHAGGGCALTTAVGCTGTDRFWLGADTDCSQCCIDVPAEAVQEGEPACFDGYVDVYDAGCERVPPAFVSLELGDFVAGAFGTFRENPDGSGAELRDSDWYQFTVAGPGLIRVHVRCESALPEVSLYAAGPPENPCQVSLLASSIAQRRCEEMIVAAGVESGTYYAAIAPDWYTGAPCGTAYLAWIDALPAGACQVGTACAIRSANVCLALGGVWTAGASCPCAGSRAGDANCDGAVNAFDIDPFVLAMADPAAYEAAYPGCDRNCVADVNRDGAVDAFDIDPFVAILVGG